MVQDQVRSRNRIAPVNILVVGSGGREHALCWTLAASPLANQLYCAPGNGGIAEVAVCVDVAADDVDGLVKFATSTSIRFAVVGPEVPLVAGLVDALEAAGIATFGPSAAAAQLEASKSFTKDVCARAGIPTATWNNFVEPDGAKAFARKLGAPVVVKADGLAAGKGVLICNTLEEADAGIDAILGGKFGAAGNRIVVEQYLDGTEVSVFALVHGLQVQWLASAQDHKQIGEGDTGPNTGGMGAYSPAPEMTPELEAKVMQQVLLPTARQMADDGRPYTGVLFAGLMIVDGEPILLEYNVRFGDPECQAILPRLRSDLLTLLIAARDGALERVSARWSDDAALTVVLASKGYPGSYGKGSEIRGIAEANKLEGVTVFHAGTVRDGKTLRAVAGRVLNVSALGRDVGEAQKRAYAAVDRIDWPEGFYRRDIGWRALAGSHE